MESDALKTILSSLSWHAFSAYVFELFSLRDTVNPAGSVNLQETQDLSAEIGEGVFERRYSQGLEFTQFTGIFVHPLPLELFSRPSETKVVDPGLTEKIKRYKSASEEREAGWQFNLDGTLCIDHLAFVTNAADLLREQYESSVLPKLSGVLESIDYDATPMIGSCDSFAELAPQDAGEALNRFMLKYKGSLAISLGEERISVSNVVAGKYITGGVLRATRSPCEPVFSDVLALQLAEFEDLLNRDPTERELESFLGAHYRDIFGYKYDRIETQLWLRFPEFDVSDKERRLDVFLRNTVERDWELFEIKRCTKLTRTYRDVPVLASEITAAIQQVRNYNDILSQEEVHRRLRAEGIEYFRPSLHLVVGRSPEISTAQWRWLKKTNEHDVRLVTFDDLLNEMRVRLEHQLELERRRVIGCNGDQT